MMMERLLASAADIERLLDTTAAAEWLTTHGVHLPPATLRKLRRIGGGPQYRRLNRRPYYTAAESQGVVRGVRAVGRGDGRGARRLG